ncbi:MAG: hypothetical protein WC881_04420 [Elusimicrobiota bacterium]|jgi:hypothetical protein
MEPMNALQALLLSAGLAGMDAVPMPPPITSAPVIMAEQPQLLVSVPLAEISAAANAAAVTQPVGRGQITFRAGLDPRANTWIKFQQDKIITAHPESELTGGIQERFPAGTYRFAIKGDALHASPIAAPHTPAAQVSVSGLLHAAYNAAPHAAIAPLKYAMLYEDGSLIPASVCLLRKDDNGILWVTYAKAADLQRIQWFVAVNGVMYGMKLEGEALAFYAQTMPATQIERFPEKRLW